MSNIYITAKPGAKKNEVIKIDESHYRVMVKASPTDGKANEAIMKILSDYFDLPKSRFKMIRGHRARQKVISIVESSGK